MSAAVVMRTHGAPMPKAASQTELLGDLAELALCLAEQDAGPVDETAAVRLTAEMTRLVQQALATVAALERLDMVEPSTPLGEQDWEPETWVGVRTADSGPPRLGDVCFACTVELSVARRQLDQARDYDARVSAVETARRKLYRAIHALAQVAPGSGPLVLSESLEQRLDDELESSLAVRRLYCEFRQNMRRPVDESGEGVLTALRYAAGALAALTASTHYRAVRASDAALLRSQHERLLEWSRAGKPRAAGLQLLEDIWTCAGLLRDINRRQELRAHDTKLIAELLAGQSLDRAGWLGKLGRLVGLDDSLDRLIAQLRAGQGTEVVVDILAQLSLLA
jgi:hypothetical protein